MRKNWRVGYTHTHWTSRAGCEDVVAGVLWADVKNDTADFLPTRATCTWEKKRRRLLFLATGWTEQESLQVQPAVCLTGCATSEESGKGRDGEWLIAWQVESVTGSWSLSSLAGASSCCCCRVWIYLVVLCIVLWWADRGPSRQLPSAKCRNIPLQI